MKKLLLIMAVLLSLQTEVRAQSYHRLTNLPHLYINTFTGKEVTSKTEQVWARLWMVDEHDVVDYYDSITIRGRGNSTWELAKKPYRIKFSKKTRLLGSERANAKKWTLLANFADKTMMRNALASYIGDLCGQPFTPAAKFVDLTLNGVYRGCYQLSDQIDVRKKRVDIAEQDYPLTATSNITGGYLIEADGFMDYVAGVNGWKTGKGVPMTIHYPDEEEIDSRQLNYISQYVNRFENRLFASNYKDAQNGYRAYVDSTSLVSWYLASEITGNPDFVWSMYYYKECDDDRLYFGPMWDYDIAFNNDNRLTSSDPTHRLMADVAFTNYGLEQWINRMWADEWFQRLVFRHYIALYTTGLEEKLLHKIDSLNILLQESQQLNYQKWNISTRALREVVLYSTYDAYVADLRRYVPARLSALLSAFAGRQPDAIDISDYERITPDFVPVSDHYYTFFNVGSGTVLDLDANGQLVANAHLADSHSQQWRVVPLQNGYRQLVNRMNGLALIDPTAGTATETTNMGTQLAVATADSTVKAQQWNIVKQGESAYNLNNRNSKHTANLYGGGTSNETPVISYTNDSRNATSRNRQWSLMPADVIDDTGIHGIEGPALDYALAYNKDGKYLHFGSDHLNSLSFSVKVYNSAGRLVLQFPASQGCSVAHLSAGMYVVVWHDHGTHAVKFFR